MRILIDLQGAQSESRFRGIGRYALALALGVARNAGPHEVWLLLNGALGEAVEDLRLAFEALVPPERICVFDCLAPVAEQHEQDHGGAWRTRASETLREYVIGQLRPDAVLVTSLFEGYIDDSVTSVGQFGPGALTAVVLYDLIPFLKPAAYLPTPGQRAYYERKIGSLRRAGLLLAISDYSRQEAIDALGLDPAGVVSISTAVDASFAPARHDPAQQAALRQRFGLTRAMLMYAPGGFDARKNIEGLIEAFSLLPPALRAGHQLLIASKLDESERRRLCAHGARCGLAPDELILTGYVSDQALIALYSLAALFVFPSLHEGFGLPALEAMACGALVIGADNTSIPEVIGCAEALFDAATPASIAAKIAQVLGDEAMRARLRAHGRAQAGKFSWDLSARRALAALEARHAARTAAAALAATATAPAAGQIKRRLAFVTPLPPERTGIADYAVQLLPALLEHFDIELVLQQSAVRLPPELARLPQRTPAWFAANAAGYDQILYQFGNSPFHSHMFALLQAHPGVVVLHDFFLSSVLAYEQMTGAMPGAWAEALRHSHGYLALRASMAADGQERAKDDYPCNLAVLEAATRVIVHSEHARSLAGAWYGAAAARNWSVLPLPRVAPAAPDRRAARQALGIRADAFLVCSFGFISPTKLSAELVRAWIASPLHARRDCELVLVGENHGGAYGVDLTAALKAANARGAAAHARIRIAGWCDEASYQLYLQAADLGVQLRRVSRGETSAAVLDCMNYGLPTIVNAIGSMAELPDDTVCMLPERFEADQLSAALAALHADAPRRAALGARAAHLLHTRHSPASCAQLYRAALDLELAEAAGGRRALIGALAALTPADAADPDLRRLAECVARAPDPLAPRQLLVDVTTIVRHDLKTGIERVVRHQLLELLRLERPGPRVEPVYLSERDGRWHYRYARHYACALLGMPGMADAAHDPVLDLQAGDLFYSADYAPAAVMQAARSGIYADWRARGVSINFLVHDLLPVLQPQFFPPQADQTHGAWLACIAEQADRLICISEAVAQDMLGWLAAHRPARKRQLKLALLRHGADLEDAAAPAEAGAALDPRVAQFGAAPSFLMVGTIEPRKGHLQALDAFEALWRDGAQVNLVIVGNEGWKPLADAERRTIPRITARLRAHPELGRRLFWLGGIDDACLRQVYAAGACLLCPSEGEGFGLPLIEAASHGLPVIARDLPVFHEVAREHAFYFGGLGGAELAGAVRAWLDLHARGAHPASTGMQWCTWRDNALELLAVLDGGRPERVWPAAPEAG